MPSVGVKSSELSSDPQRQETRMMGLSGGKTISVKRFAVLIQNTRATHRQTDGNAVAYTYASIASRGLKRLSAHHVTRKVKTRLLDCRVVSNLQFLAAFH